MASTKNKNSDTKKIIIDASEHTINQSLISQTAIEIIETLQQHNHEAYLVGGCVRDLLINRVPKDFDIATSATPEQTVKLFKRSRIIGRRFRIVHVRCGRETHEITTFRGEHDGAEQNQQGMLLRDNIYGSVEEDAIRRDFTVNALYYDISDHAVHDYVNGIEDLNKKQIHVIGDPEQRFREDPVRMLRAVRLATKLDFKIEHSTAKQISPLKNLLADVPPARLFDEVLKLFMAGYGENTFTMLEEFELFEILFPDTATIYKSNSHYRQLIINGLVNTDLRIHNKQRVTPAYLFAVLLWPVFAEQLEKAKSQKLSFFQCMHIACDVAVTRGVQRVQLPRRFSMPMKDIWTMQYRLERRHGKRADKLFQHPRFRAAYDFVLLREASGENLQGLGQWWTEYQEVDEEQRRTMANSLSGKTKRPTKQRKPGKPR